MAVNRWTGDAPEVAKQLVFNAPEVDATSATVVVTIGGNSMTFGSWDPAAIVDGLDESGFPELIGLTLTVTGDESDSLAVTGQPNEDFDLSIAIEPTVEVEFNQGQTQVNQYSLVSFSGATSGTFKLTCNGEQTAAINLKDTGALNAAGTETAINALTSFTSGDVDATIQGDELRLEWKGNYAGGPVNVSVDGDGLDNGGNIVIKEQQPARPATNDVWFLGSDDDFQFNISDGTTAVTLKTNETDPDIAAKLTDAWGGRVDVYSELIGSETINRRFYILDMKGFPGSTTTLSVSSITPSVGTPGVAIAKQIDRTDTTPSHYWIVDLRDGDLYVDLYGTSVQLIAGGGTTLRNTLNSVDQFQEWWTYNVLTDGDLEGTLAGENLYLLEWRSDSSRLANDYLTSTPSTDGGEPLPDGALSIGEDTDGGQLIEIQIGGPTNAADSAIHSIHIEANDPQRTASLAGTFKLLFSEGETSAITLGASAAALDTIVEAATGVTVSVSGDGTASSPYLIDYTGDSSARTLPSVSDKAITGDGSATVTAPRSSKAARSATALVKVSPDANGGTFRITNGSEGPVEFDHGDDAAAFKTNLELFSSLSTTADTAVTYSATQSAYLVTYQNGLADQAVGVLSVLDSSLTTANSVNTTKGIAVHPGGPGDFSDAKNWSLGVLPNAGDTIVLDRAAAPITYGLRVFHEVSIDASTDVLTVTNGTDLQNDQAVKFVFGSTGPTGLSEATTYYVVNVDHVAGTFQVATAVSGAAVNITAAGTGPHYCGVIAEDVKIMASFTESIGLPFRNEENYEEYRTKHLQIGVESTGQIEIGQGDGNGSGRLHLDISGSEGQVTVYGTGSTQTIGQPPMLLDAFTDAGNLLIYGGDVGIATYEDETAKIGSFNVVDGVLSIGSLTVSGNAIWTSGAVNSRRLSVAGLVHVK